MDDASKKKKLLQRLFEAVFLLKNPGGTNTSKTADEAHKKMLEEIETKKKLIREGLERLEDKIKKIEGL